jgi:cytochrome d oxidase, subunit II (cydB)
MIEGFDLPAVWFVLLGLLLAGYAVLDGFDLGVGILHFFAKDDRERRIFLNAIGPIWDGNEVWLVVFGGALFAAFPMAYATLFSGLYLVFMLVLFALIFRAVSIDFRSKIHSPRWRSFWDFGFFFASFIATFLFGVGIGNMMIGVPLDDRGVFIGRFLDLLNPYALLVGALTLAMFAMHGAIYLFLKTPPGRLLVRLRSMMWHTWGIFLVLYLLTTIYTLMRIPRAVANFEHLPWAGGIVVLSVFLIANIPRSIYRRRYFIAFFSSSFMITSLVSLFGIALWPNLVTASNNPAFSLTVYDAASSEATLKTMLIFVLVGMPFVLTYTGIVYWTFRGKVEVPEEGY